MSFSVCVSEWVGVCMSVAADRSEVSSVCVSLSVKCVGGWDLWSLCWETAEWKLMKTDQTSIFLSHSLSFLLFPYLSRSVSHSLPLCSFLLHYLCSVSRSPKTFHFQKYSHLYTKRLFLTSPHRSPSPFTPNVIFHHNNFICHTLLWHHKSY